MDSFLLIKPDAIERNDICDEILDAIAGHELEIVERRTIRLTAKQIAGIWPQYSNGRCPFTFALLCEYLVDRDVVVLKVEGADPLESCRKLKWDIRRRHGMCTFSNCLHTPSSENEMRIQFSVLADLDTVRVSVSGPTSKSVQLNGVWGRLALRADGAGEISARMWKYAQQAGWDRIWTAWAPTHPTEHAVILFDDSSHSLDYCASCLFEVFPSWQPEQALAAVIEVDRIGQIMISTESRGEMTDICDRLVGWGLTAGHS